MSTEIVIGDINPVYLTSFSFNSASMLQMHMKVELYYSITGEINTERGHSTCQGEVQFTVGEVMKQRNAVGTVSY